MDADLRQPTLPEQATGASPIAQFFIPAAASLQERRPRTLKHGDTFGLFDPNGDVIYGPGSPEGIFHRDTRHLSHLFLTVAGVRPLLLSSTLRDDNATLTCDLTNPDFYDADGRVVLAHDLIHIRRSRFLWNSACFERVTVRNFSEAAHGIRLQLAFAADFADIFEVRGAVRQKRGRMRPPDVGRDRILLAYDGLDGRCRETLIRFDPKPVELSGDRAVLQFNLAPRQRAAAFVIIACEPERFERPLRRNFFVSFRDARRALSVSSGRAAAVETSNEIFNEIVRRSVSDLYMLMTDTADGAYPYAGIPWFSTVFGRDAIITAIQMLWIDPTIARGVLAHLAANQATAEDPKADAEPGKILHEVRFGEMAELGEVPFRRYYGSIDSTPLFLMLAGGYLARTGDAGFLETLWPNVEAALTWITAYGDRDGDGFLEYARRNNQGLANQGWKDSEDSVSHADGSLAEGPIALCEVQAYAFAALLAAADIAAHLGHKQRAAELSQRAETLKQAFDAAFWDSDLGMYVLALDGEKRACRVRASNAGHVLLCGLALPERAHSVARELMSSRFYSGWGVRTLASTEIRYNPMSYHNGSVWPHDNALIAAGLARYGFTTEAARVFQGLAAAAGHVDFRRLPELFCGFPRRRGQGPTFYPVACSPQAWSAATPLSLLQACLGLGFQPAEATIRFDHPVLPAFLDEVFLRGLTLPQGRADVAIRRNGKELAVSVLSRTGDVKVLTVH
jgi:glycogen debranching enzyme